MEVKLNGTNLHYTVIGKGVPIVFLHGGLGFDHTYFRPWMDVLSERFQVVYYDMRGNGRSDGRDELKGVDHSTWVEDLEALRAHLGFERFVLVGHSYGGVLGQEYALRYQQHLSGMVLMTTLAAWDYNEEIIANAEARGTSEQIAIVKGMFNHVSGAEAFEELCGIITPLYFKRVDPEVLERIGANTKLSHQAYNRAFVELLPLFDTVSQLKDIEVPTLVIAGRDDWITPVKQAERIHSHLPNSDLVVFEESGHFPFIEEHEHFIQVLGNWATALRG